MVFKARLIVAVPVIIASLSLSSTMTTVVGAQNSKAHARRRAQTYGATSWPTPSPTWSKGNGYGGGNDDGDGDDDGDDDNDDGDADAPKFDPQVTLRFIARTFDSGTEESDSFVVEEVDEVYEATVNHKLNSDGVVSLAAAKGLIRKVKCKKKGTITIRLDKRINPKNRKRLFPKGATVVVASEDFGRCRLDKGPDRKKSNSTEINSSNRFENQDGFLVVKKVDKVKDDTLRIRGKATIIFGVFEEASIELRAVEDPERRRELLGESTALVDTHNVEPGGGRIRRLATTIEFSEDVSFLVFKVTAAARLVDRSGFRILTATWNRFTLDFSFEVFVDFEIQAEFSTTFNIKALKKPKAKLIPFVNVPLYAVPSIPLSRSFLRLPPLKLGIFYEMPFLFKFSDVEIEKSFGASVKVTFKSGRKAVQFSARGSWFNLNLGAEVTDNEPLSLEHEIFPVDQATGDPLTIKGSFFAGFQPAVATYLFPILEERLFLDMGLQVSAKAALAFGAFPPLDEDTSLLADFGVCDECHFVEINVAVKIENFSIFTRIGISFGRIVIFGRGIVIDVQWVNTISVSRQLPGNPSITAELARACFFLLTDEKITTCGKQCCDEKQDEVCVVDASKNPPAPKCTTEVPSQAPSKGSPKPSPAPRTFPPFSESAFCPGQPNCPFFCESFGNENFVLDLTQSRGDFLVGHQLLGLATLIILYEGREIFRTSGIPDNFDVLEDTVTLPEEGDSTVINVQLRSSEESWFFSIECIEETPSPTTASPTIAPTTPQPTPKGTPGPEKQTPSPEKAAGLPPTPPSIPSGDGFTFPPIVVANNTDAPTVAP